MSTPQGGKPAPKVAASPQPKQSPAMPGTGVRPDSPSRNRPVAVRAASPPKDQPPARIPSSPSKQQQGIPARATSPGRGPSSPASASKQQQPASPRQQAAPVKASPTKQQQPASPRQQAAQVKASPVKASPSKQPPASPSKQVALQQLLKDEKTIVEQKQSELKKLTERLEEAKSAAKKLESELSTKKTTREGELTTIKTQDEALTKQIKSSIDSRQTQLTATNARLKSKRDEKLALDKEMDQIQKRHKADCDAREKTIASAKEKIAREIEAHTKATEAIRSEKADRLVAINDVKSSYEKEIVVLKKELAEGKDAAATRKRRKSGPTPSAPAMSLMKKHEEEIEKREEEIGDLEARLKQRTNILKKLKTQITNLSQQGDTTQAELLESKRKEIVAQKEAHLKAMNYLRGQLADLKKIEGWSEEQMTEQMKKEMSESITKSNQTEESCKDDSIVTGFKDKITSLTKATAAQVAELTKLAEASQDRSKAEAACTKATEGFQEIIDSLKLEIKKSEETFKATDASIKSTQKEIKTATAKLVLADPKTRHHLDAPSKSKTKRARSPSPEKTKRKGKN